MSNGLKDSAWNNGATTANTATGNTATGNSAVPSYLNNLVSLLGVSSIMNDTRSTVEMAAIIEEINKRVDGWKDSTISMAKKAIMPEVRSVDQTLSPRLSAFMLSVRSGDVIMAMPVFLFSRQTMTLDEENINTGNVGLGIGLGNQVLLSRTPVKQIRIENLRNIIGREKEEQKQNGVTDVTLVTAIVLDLDTIVEFNTATQDGKAKVAADIVLKEWENAIKIQIANACVVAKQPLGSPFIGKDGNIDNAYGPAKFAIARSEGINMVQFRNGIPSPANLKINMRTNSRENNANNPDAQRDIVTTLANVSLVSVPFGLYKPAMDQQSMMSMMTGEMPDAYALGYRPFQPVVVMNSATAGVQMGSNDTVFSWLMGLWSVLTTNNRYIWSEGIRSLSNTARGTLVDLDARIDTEIAVGCPNLAVVRTPENKLTQNKMKDVDFMSSWIRRNVRPNAAFAIDPSEMSVDGALNNLLMHLCSKEKSVQSKATVVACIDAMTNNGFSAILAENVKAGKGWTINKPILHRSNTLVPQGTYTHNGQVRSLGEIDEMFLSNVCAKDRASLVAYLTAMYGDGMTEEAVRRYRMTISLPNIVGGEVNITNFANRYFFDPEFTMAFAQAFDALGDLQVSGTVGLYDSQISIYAPGVDFASSAVAGATGFGIAPNGSVIGASTVFDFFNR